MRKLMFRGKRKDYNVWVYGFYSYLFDEKANDYKHEIVFQHMESADMSYPYPSCHTIWAEVIPETVGQLICTIPNTSIYVDNSQELYEGDIFKTKGSETKYVARYDGYGEYYGISNEGDKYGAYTLRFTSQNIKNKGIEIIGSIHDNPELLT